MKTKRPHQIAEEVRPCATSSRSAGHTLPELVISMALFILLVGGIVAGNLFGLRLFEMTKAKLGASDEARTALAKMVGEIRSAKIIRVGSGTVSNFTPVAINLQIVGSAIKIHATTNTNTFVQYFWDSATKRLNRTTSAGAVSVIANFVSNSIVFKAENHMGIVLTNSQKNQAISLKLEFYQLQYPALSIGPGNLFDYYKLETRITPRTLE